MTEELSLHIKTAAIKYQDQVTHKEHKLSTILKPKTFKLKVWQTHHGDALSLFPHMAGKARGFSSISNSTALVAFMKSPLS